jgi:hypothetical protein
MAGPYAPAPDDRVALGPNPAPDNNANSDAIAIVQAVLAQMAGFPGNSSIPADNATNATNLQTIVGTFMGPGLPPIGGAGDDTTNIQNLLNLAGVAPLQVGTFNYSAPLTVPTGGGLTCLLATESFGDPSADYGVGGLALQGAILKATDTFADANSATGTIVMTSPEGVQGGGQRLQGITLDLSNTPDGNDLHGILIQDNTACVTLKGVVVYGGGDAQLGGDCLHAVAATYSPPDLLTLDHCHFVGGTGGVYMSGVADSYIYMTESTGNKNYAWSIVNGNNTRFDCCKGETSTAGPGWLFTANAGFTGIVHLSNCTSQDNYEDGWKFTGSGTGTYMLGGCSDDGSGTDGTHSGMDVTSFSGTVKAPGFVTRVASGSPVYGVSMTSSNTVDLRAGNITGATSPYYNGGGNTSFIGTAAPGEFLCTPTKYDTTNTFSTTSATYAAVSSANVNTGSFVAPPSGFVWVEASFVVTEATGATVIGFALAAHGTVTPLLGDAWQCTLANDAYSDVRTVKFLVPVTPGTSYNLDLLFASTTNSLTIKSQAFTGTSLTASTEGGPILMNVRAV